ncbi:hypothetical protein SCOR_28275 [Sulfidibacter corallicola]|uniref:Uncharacterized protein n=1 Tax=Sulfidibacter corallicola TaxID=2818388 RepID=A0A8A4TKR9_SULCO|nr:hypothetical protein [Sulfidibacter corallicola]QTD50546.1 hypothetical protein J3U87_33600 [Sulfidibacter corallicola]
MIRALRKRHGVMVALLAVATALVCLVGLLGRRPIPHQAFPEPLQIPLADWQHQLWLGQPIGGDVQVIPRLLSADSSAATVALELSPNSPTLAPDVLVYWHPGSGTDVKRALLLGSLGGLETRRFALPSRAQTEAGTLILFSLAHGDALASAVLPNPADLRGGAP